MRTEADANSAPKSLACATDEANLRNANALPRSTMPNAARVRGTNNVSQIAANAAGNAVHR